MEEVDSLSRRPNSVCISCHLELGMDRMLRRVWDSMVGRAPRVAHGTRCRV